MNLNFSGHETFPFRQLWAYKASELLKKSKTPFTKDRDDSMINKAIVNIDPKYLEIIRTSLDKTGLPKPFVQEVELLNCNIAGTTFLNLEDIEPKLKKHQLLVLKREPKNEYDGNAILILTEDGQKLGYVPQEKNEVLSNLMDAGKLLFGKLNEKTWVDNWLKLDVQVYLRDL